MKEENNFFLLDDKKEYLIYGAGGGGIKLIDVFAKSDYVLKGFIDKRANQLGNVQGIDVWNIEQLESLKGNANNIVIIITTKNVFEHSQIAYQLAEKGFSQCIYKPLPLLRGYFNENLEVISKVHDNFLIDIKIPNVQKILKVSLEYKIYYKDRLEIIDNARMADTVLAWVPVELVYNYKNSDEYGNLSMPAFFPLVELYNLFCGNKKSDFKNTLEDFYLYASEWGKKNNVEITEDLRESWIDSRIKSYQQMEKIVEYDFDFFKRNAPIVELQDKCKFHMTNSGRNRVVFLSTKGYRYVPLKMSYDDYKRWKNEDIFNEICKFLEDEHIVQTTVPIPHPYLQDIEVKYINYFKQVCFPIAMFLYKYLYRSSINVGDRYKVVEKNLLDNTKQQYCVMCDIEDEGAISRYFNCMDFKVFRSKNSNNKLTQLLDKLFYQKIKDCDFDNLDSNQKNVFIIGTRLNDELIEKEYWRKAEIIICFEKEEENFEREMRDKRFERIKLNDLFINGHMYELISYKKI